MVPYVVRVDEAAGRVWIGTSAGDAVLSYDLERDRFTVYPLSRGALVRHLAVDPRTHEVWVAYGAFPGRLPATIARITP
jgi:streptogramin lyase